MEILIAGTSSSHKKTHLQDLCMHLACVRNTTTHPPLSSTHQRSCDAYFLDGLKLQPAAGTMKMPSASAPAHPAFVVLCFMLLRSTLHGVTALRLPYPLCLPSAVRPRWSPKGATIGVISSTVATNPQGNGQLADNFLRNASAVDRCTREKPNSLMLLPSTEPLPSPSCLSCPPSSPASSSLSHAPPVPVPAACPFTVLPRGDLPPLCCDRPL